MIIESETEIVVNYDCDVLLPLNSYHEAYQSILHHTHDVIYPYGQGMYQKQVKATDEIVSEFLQTTDYSILNNNSSTSTSDFGWAQFFNRQVYIDGGMENENFKAYAPEDLEHSRGENSWFNNPYMSSNMEEWEKIQQMNKEQLKEYYSRQEYLKKYVSI